MPLTLSSRYFNQQVSRAKQLACREPVFITSRGKPAHVLLSYEAYLRLADQQDRIADLLAMPGAEAVELDIHRSRETPREADFS